MPLIAVDANDLAAYSDIAEAIQYAADSQSMLLLCYCCFSRTDAIPVEPRVAGNPAGWSGDVGAQGAAGRWPGLRAFLPGVDR